MARQQVGEARLSIRASGFARIPAELYQTPAWVLDVLAMHINLTGLSVWEPACGEGHMVRALQAAGAHVTATDIHEHGFEGQADTFDFLAPMPRTQEFYFDSIITNPPYGPGGRTGVAFIEKGLERIPAGGLLALLLPVDFDSASTRAHLFADCPDFAAKVILRRRIMWFDPPAGEKVSTPSANHAWFIWERSHVRRGPAISLYGPAKAQEMEAA